MNMMCPVIRTGELERQAAVARQLGSPFVANVLGAADRHLSLAPRSAERIRNWTGDPSAAAVAMRVNAALHALARRGHFGRLTALYRGEHQDFDGAIAEALAGADWFICSWLDSCPQTNEVGRSAAIAAALMHETARDGLPLELFEIGASAGLNLNLARYAFELGGLQAGDPSSLVRIVPLWKGPPPPSGPIVLARAEGVDLKPLDPSCAATRERLQAFVWADQHARAERLAQALDLAMRFPPNVQKGHAIQWLEQRLAEKQPSGRRRAVVHSMLIQYLSADEQQAIDTLMADAGKRADSSRPLCRIGFEWTPDRREVQLNLTVWPQGQTRTLALCHPYGNSVTWIAEKDVPDVAAA
jgi:hypothetical protein